MYVDQFPENDLARHWSERSGVPIAASIREALTLGTGTIAVDGVLIIGDGYDELTLGKVNRESQRFMKSSLTDIAKQDVQAAVLACTELEMIVDVRANVLPIYDCTSIHALAGVDFILG